MHAIELWMEDLGLGKYAKVLVDSEVDFEILPEISDEDLKDLDIPLGPRKKLLKAIAALNGQSQAHPVAADSSAERRQLTVMFCDLVGSTALSERLDPEDLGDVIRAYQQCCSDIIESFDGTIARYFGDGLLVYFGYPQAHEDDAERSIRAGLRIVEAISKLNPLGIQLQTCIGIATGPVVVGELIGEGASREQAVLGETPNLAARLQSLAQPDSVVIGNRTWRLSGAMFDYKDLGKQPLKGFAEPVQAWQAVVERSIESRFEAVHGSSITSIVGRNDDMEILRQCWRQASAGSGQVVMVSGEPGIGKSRLLQTLRDHLVDEPYQSIRFYCAQYYQTSALFPVIAQLEREAGMQRDDDDDAKLKKLDALIRQCDYSDTGSIASLADLMSIAVVDADADSAATEMSPAARKEEILDTLVQRIVVLSISQPVLLIFEDLHWVDPSTLEFLERVVASIKGNRVLVLATARPEFTAPWSEQPHNTNVVLDRLGGDGIRQLVSKIIDGKRLPESVLDIICEKTDGVPLFVEELTKNVLEAGYLKETDEGYELTGSLPQLAVPSTLQDSLMARLDRMQSVKEIAQTGSVIGRIFSWEMLEAVASLAKENLKRGLRQLQDAEIVFGHGAPPEANYTFKHALVQDAAYSSLLRTKRLLLHKKIADVLETKFPHQAQTKPELLAHHHSGAGATELAISYWQRAGQRALGRSAFLESVSHCNKGLELLRTLPESMESVERELDLRSSLGVGLVATQGYAADAISQNYARSQQLCESLGETPRAIPSLYGLWVYHLLRGHRDSSQKFARSLYRYAAQPEQPLVTRSALAITTFYSGDRIEANNYLDDAVALFSADSQQQLASAYGEDAALLANFYQYWNLWLSGYPDQAVTQLHNTNKYVKQIGTPYVVATSLLFEMILWHELRDIDGVTRTASRFAAHSTEHGFPFFVALSMAGSGWVLAKQEKFDKGIAEIQQGIASFRLTGAQLPISYWLHYLVQAQQNGNRTEDGLASVDEALALCQSQLDDFYEAELYRLKGELLLDNDASEAAQHCFERSIELSRENNSKALELRATVSLSKLLLDQGRPEKARNELESIYEWFTEGHEYQDLIDARDLIQQLSPGSA